MTLLQTFRLIGSDIARMSSLMNIPLFPLGFIFLALYPSNVALALYRVSHFFYVKRLRFLAWPVYLANLYLTGADIVPNSVIGRGCFLGHVVGTVIAGRLGSNVSLFGAPGIGGGAANDDIGAGPGLPVVGDDVVVGYRASILGPVRIGDRCLIGACALVLKDVPAGKHVMGTPGRVVGGRENAIDYEARARGAHG